MRVEPLTCSIGAELFGVNLAEAVHDDRLLMSATPVTWPTMLPNWRRGVPSIPMHQRGLVAMSRMLPTVSFGGVDRPFLMSLCRCPKICRSSVMTSAEHPAALARSVRQVVFAGAVWNLMSEPSM